MNPVTVSVVILHLFMAIVNADFNYTEEDISLYLYTKDNPDDPEYLPAANFSKLSESVYFDASKKNYFVIHGYLGNHTKEVNTYIRPALLQATDSNIFFPDWSPYAYLNQTLAEPALPFVGNCLGNYIKQMKSAYSLRSSDFFVVGFSWGAQVAGATGSAADGEIEYLVGLDPASTVYNLLHADCAETVQTIATSYIGTTTGSVGKSSFYPNGGSLQPACNETDVGCLHQMAVRYFGESVVSGGFTGVKCDSYENYTAGLCDGNPTAKFGGLNIDKAASGNYFLKTNAEPPYSMDSTSSTPTLQTISLMSLFFCILLTCINK